MMIFKKIIIYMDKMLKKWKVLVKNSILELETLLNH